MCIIDDIKQLEELSAQIKKKILKERDPAKFVKLSRRFNKFNQKLDSLISEVINQHKFKKER